MASRPRRRSPRGGPSLALPLIGLGVVAVLGLALIASSLGWLEPREAPAPAAPPPGSVAVPVAARPLSAYHAIQLEDLLDPVTGQLAVIHLPEDSVLPETFVAPKDLLGRVLGRDKTPGRVFREPDFLPEGTRPGIVAGIPAGKVALRIEASKVTGTVGLRRGDRFDLVATWRESSRGAVRQPYEGAGTNTGGPRAEVVRIAENAAIVEPLSARRKPDGPGGPGPVVEEMVIAVAPAEVPLVTEALELAARIDCVPRSGRPVSEMDLEAIVSQSASRVGVDASGRPRKTVVETIQGNQRFLLEVPEAPPVPDPDGIPADGRRSGLGS